MSYEKCKYPENSGKPSAPNEILYKDKTLISQVNVDSHLEKVQGRQWDFQSTGAKLLLYAQKQTSNCVCGVISGIFP